MIRVVLQSVTGPQPAHKFPTFYGTHFHAQMRPAFVPNLIQVNPVHFLPPYSFNPLKTELNPQCKSQLAELFCGVFKLCASFSKNLNISRTKRQKFVK